MPRENEGFNKEDFADNIGRLLLFATAGDYMIRYAEREKLNACLQSYDVLISKGFNNENDIINLFNVMAGINAFSKTKSSEEFTLTYGTLENIGVSFPAYVQIYNDDLTGKYDHILNVVDYFKEKGYSDSYALSSTKGMANALFDGFRQAITNHCIKEGNFDKNKKYPEEYVAATRLIEQFVFDFATLPTEQFDYNKAFRDLKNNLLNTLKNNYYCLSSMLEDYQLVLNQIDHDLSSGSFPQYDNSPTRD